MELYTELFLEPQYTVRKLPGYSPKIASNPFKSFEQIPVKSRYKFLLEEAQFSIMNFIKGPVCRGQIALNVIEEHFWVMFMDPETIDPELDAATLQESQRSQRSQRKLGYTWLPINLSLVCIWIFYAWMANLIF